MTPLELYFPRIFCINLDRRPDRWKEAQQEMAQYGLTQVERFPGICGNVLREAGVASASYGDSGCTASHRALLDLVIAGSWDRVLILEDDFQIVHLDFNRRFAEMVSWIPDDWDMLYLGGHYAEAPECRVNQHVIKHRHMLTTSSYGITREFAAKIRPQMGELLPGGGTPIDTIYGTLQHNHPEYRCYILQPRLMVQRLSLSDITGRADHNDWPMLDTRHENMV